jgi:hypothetical protein
MTKQCYDVHLTEEYTFECVRIYASSGGEAIQLTQELFPGVQVAGANLSPEWSNDEQ